MKKLFTLFAAMAISATVMASPFEAKNIGTTLKQRPNFARSIEQVAKARTAQRTTDTYHIESKRYVLCIYSQYDNSWYISFSDAQKQVQLYYYSSTPDFAGSFTLENCNTMFTYVRDIESSQNISFETLEFTTQGEDPTVASEITGSGTLTDGTEVSFHLLKSAPLEPKDTVYVEAALESFVPSSPASGNKSTIVATSTDAAGATIEYKISYQGIIGTFTDLDVDNSGITNRRSEEFCQLNHGSIAVSMNNDNELAINAEMICDDTLCYVLNLEGMYPIAGEKNVEAHNMEITDLYGIIYYLTGSNDDYSQIQATIYSYPYEGDYTSAMSIMMTDTAGQYINSQLMKQALITKDENGNQVLDARYLGNDNVDYTLHMDIAKVAATDTIDFHSTTGDLADWISKLGAVQLMSYSEDQKNFISIVYDATELVSGHYNTISPQFFTYCKLALDADSENPQEHNLNWFDVNIETDGETFSLTGTCQAGTYFVKLDITGLVSRPGEEGNTYDNKDEDVDVNYSCTEIADFAVYPADGYAFVRAYSEERQDMFAAIFNVNGDNLPEGVYEINDSFAVGTAQPGEFDLSTSTLYPTFYATVAESGNLNIPFWLCVGGTIEVSYDEEGNLSLVADMVNTWGRSIKVIINDSVLGFSHVGSHLEQNGKYLEGNNIVIRRDGQRFNLFGQKTK